LGWKPIFKHLLLEVQLITLVHCPKYLAEIVSAKAAALSVASFVAPLRCTTKAFHVNR
jgi:hypothetical protein